MEGVGNFFLYTLLSVPCTLTRTYKTHIPTHTWAYECVHTLARLLPYVAVCCNAVHCNTVHRTATHCNIWNGVHTSVCTHARLHRWVEHTGGAVAAHMCSIPSVIWNGSTCVLHKQCHVDIAVYVCYISSIIWTWKYMCAVYVVSYGYGSTCVLYK